MLHRFGGLLLGMLLLGAGSTGTHAQLVYGRVIEKDSGRGVGTVTIEMLDAGGAIHRETLSDTTGWFRVRAALPGVYRIRARIIGFREVVSAPLTLDQAAQTEIEITLNPAAVTLEPIRVVAERSLMHGRLAEYFERAEWTKRTGLGRVYMRNDLEELGPHALGYLFDRVARRPDCPMTYFLDGLASDREQLEDIRSETVEGVEVYRSMLELPPEYYTRAQCAATMVWLRRDLPGRRMGWKRIVAMSAGVVGALFLLRGLYSGF
jgi:hypothetical protein